MKKSVFLDWLCAGFYAFSQLIAVTGAVVIVAWTALGWLAAILLWGTAGGGASLALWLSSILAAVWFLIRDHAELRIDQIDRRIEARARAWKNR
jgi:fatty acid desaturase